MVLDKLLSVATKSMSMSDEVWFRHANPWSGWTRFATYPFLILAFWSHDWLGIWFLIPVVVVFVWIWINPRVFPKPKSTNNWMSKVVFGEIKEIFRFRRFMHRSLEKVRLIWQLVCICYNFRKMARLAYG